MRASTLRQFDALAPVLQRMMQHIIFTALRCLVIIIRKRACPTLPLHALAPHHLRPTPPNQRSSHTHTNASCSAPVRCLGWCVFDRAEPRDAASGAHNSDALEWRRQAMAVVEYHSHMRRYTHGSNKNDLDQGINELVRVLQDQR